MGNIIIINGRSNSGKDAMCEICADVYGQVYNVSTVDIVRQASKLFGLSDTKTDENSRNFMGELKRLVDKYNDHSYNYIHEKYLNIKNTAEEILETDEFTMFIHCREPKNIQRFVDRYSNTDNCITLLFKAPFENDSETNIPDKDVYNYKYDYTIRNNGTLDDLREKVIRFIKTIKESI